MVYHPKKRGKGGKGEEYKEKGEDEKKELRNEEDFLKGGEERKRRRRGKRESRNRIKTDEERTKRRT